jgi:hypothetical protein
MNREYVACQHKKVIAVVFLILLCLCVPFVGYSFAQVAVGLSAGDTFTYQVSSDSNTPLIYQIIYEPKNANSIQIQVDSVDSAGIICLNITESFKNGTKNSWIQNKDLTSAEGFPIIAANLNVNDLLWSAQASSPSISELVTQNYLDGSREVVYATVPSSESGYNRIDYKFDRSTGMPVEIRFVESDEVSTVLMLADSNVWDISESPSPSPSSTVTSDSSSPSPSPTVPEFPSSVAVVFLLTFVLVGVITYKTKSKHI